MAYKPAKGWAVASGMGGSVEVSPSLPHLSPRAHTHRPHPQPPQSVTRGLAVDLAPTRINCILPGAVDTPLWGPLSPEAKAATFKHFEDKLLTGKVGLPEEVAEGYLYLMKG